MGEGEGVEKVGEILEKGKSLESADQRLARRNVHENQQIKREGK